MEELAEEVEEKDGATMVRDLPADERPREKLIAQGVDFLSNTELLAILMRTGTKRDSVLSLAQKVLTMYEGRGISGIVNMSPEELAKIKGIGLAKAATIVAAVELGRRISLKAAERHTIIHGPEDVAHYAMPRYRYEQQEHFVVMLLNTKNGVIAMPEVSSGSLTASVVHPREVFKFALRYSAAAMILLHNHPSGDPSPSREDIAVTERMVKAGKIMDIPVLDHVVLGDNRFISLKEQECGGL